MPGSDNKYLDEVANQLLDEALKAAEIKLTDANNKQSVTVGENGNFIIPAGPGYSTHRSFDSVQKDIALYAAEIGRPDLIPGPDKYGTVDQWDAYQAALDVVRKSGRKLNCNLVPELVGKEGKHVEVTDAKGKKRTFYVGKTTGIAPVHLAMHNRNSTGGDPIRSSEVVGVRILPSTRPMLQGRGSHGMG
jgi:hypothetical protein